jgi:hypothetical protein
LVGLGVPAVSIAAAVAAYPIGMPSGIPSTGPSEKPSSILSPRPESELGSLFGEEVANLRDPFRREVHEVEKEVHRGDLEQYAVEELKLVGVTTGPSRARALLQAPNGTSYLGSINSKVGLKGGVILKITPNSVLVREKAVNVLGQEENVDTEIQLNAQVQTNAQMNTTTPAAGNSEAGLSGRGGF